MKTLGVVMTLTAHIMLASCAPHDCDTRNGGPFGCRVGRNHIPNGATRDLKHPCVRATCSMDGHSVTVVGCSFQGGFYQHPGSAAAPLVAPKHYPYCCRHCRAVR